MAWSTRSGCTSKKRQVEAEPTDQTQIRTHLGDGVANVELVIELAVASSELNVHVEAHQHAGQVLCRRGVTSVQIHVEGATLVAVTM
jgi:hypothetical protein